MRIIHERIWDVVRTALADHSTCGLPASIGFVEGMLILAEFLPHEREPQGTSCELLGQSAGLRGHDHNTAVVTEGRESRRCWTMTGTAIRAAYALGRESSLIVAELRHFIVDTLAADIPKDRTEWKERARTVWTWCYLQDRSLDELTHQSALNDADTLKRLRTGLAFWCRCPQLSFIGYSHISQTGDSAAASNFPTMLGEREEAGKPNNDHATFLQCLVELTEVSELTMNVLR